MGTYKRVRMWQHILKLVHDVTSLFHQYGAIQNLLHFDFYHDNERQKMIKGMRIMPM